LKTSSFAYEVEYIYVTKNMIAHKTVVTEIVSSEGLKKTYITDQCALIAVKIAEKTKRFLVVFLNSFT
jgi:hypothetical protein